MSAPSCIAVYAPIRHAIVIVDRSGAAVTVPADEAPLLAQAILDAFTTPAHARQLIDGGIVDHG